MAYILWTLYIERAPVAPEEKTVCRFATWGFPRRVRALLRSLLLFTCLTERGPSSRPILQILLPPTNAALLSLLG